MSAMDVNAEREKIQREIEEIERRLGTRCPDVKAEVSSGSSLESDSEDGGSASPDDLEEDRETSTYVNMEVDSGGQSGEGDDDASLDLPRTPETCLQMNLVYQEVLQEKIEEVDLLLAQNREQQEKLTWELAGTRGTKSGDGKSLPINMFLGHFMKPYFKDKTSGIGPPANEETREKARQGIKSFEELLTVKWKSREKQLLHQAVVSDHLQHMLQPKLMSLEYLNEKRARCLDEAGRQTLEKQIQDKEGEITEINSLPEESLLGSRWDEHDWDKIANINFEGTRNAQELRKFWQNSEHPSINKKEWSEEEVEQLKAVVAKHAGLDWEAIAAELGTQRTAFQCLQKFQTYNKDFRRSEWSPEEDQMLLQLIQEMRVGKHIPYRKIAYYMEGRDSAQLIYRWTKRVDPSLKRGAWTPKEDALLLKAVAKYGEKDWFKIRTEVPGRNDIQCRDRYLHALHQDIKKGKWSAEEETKLVELTEKYGIGHWAQIASELPHRSGGQCLSKWKVLLGYRRNRKKMAGENRPLRKRKPAPRVSSSPSETSTDTSDLESLEEEEEEEEEEEKEVPKSRKEKTEGRWRVPGIELWVPTRKKRPSDVTPKELASVTLLSKGFDVHRKRKPVPGVLLEAPQVAEGPPERLSGASQPPQSKRPEEEANRSSRSTKDAWRVSLAYVKYVLRNNSYKLQRRNREIRRKRHFASDLGECVVSPSGGSDSGHHGAKEGMWKTTLYRRLMIAVTPWVGGRLQSWALRVKTEAARKSKAEFISKQLESAHLTSTPLFTLFIHLLRIDVDGCMKVIQRRKSRQLERLRSAVGEAGIKTGVQASSGPEAKALPGVLVTSVPHPTKTLIPLKKGPAPKASSSSWQAVPYHSAPKPKTVSELLREKRRAEAAGQQKVLLGRPLLRSRLEPVIQPLRSRAIRRTGAPTTPQAMPFAMVPPLAACRVPVPLVEHKLVSLEEASGESRGETGVLPSQAPPPSPQSAATPMLASPAASRGSAKVGSIQMGPLSPGPASGAQMGSQKTLTLPVPGLAAPWPTASPGLPKQILPVTFMVTPLVEKPVSLDKALGDSRGETVVPPSQAPPPSPQSAATTTPASPAASRGSATVGSLQAGTLGPGTASLAQLGSQKTPTLPVPALAAPWPTASPGHPKQILPVTFMVTPKVLFPLTIITLPSQSDAPCPVQAVALAPEEAPPETTAHGRARSALDTSSASPMQQTVLIRRPANNASPPPPVVTQTASPLKVATSNLAQAPIQKVALLSRAEGASPQTSGDRLPRQAEQSQQKPPLAPEETTLSLDYRLLSLEATVAIEGWAKRGSHLPYLPPFLCSLKTLSALLLQKETLQRQAASLWTSSGGETPSQPNPLETVRTIVQCRLRDNPAYQLLKGRFLAAFTFPAALAALPPTRVTTTLSGGRWWESQDGGEGEDSSSLEEEEEEETEEEEGADHSCEGQEDNLGDVEEPAMDRADVEQFRIRSSSRLRKKRKRRL